MPDAAALASPAILMRNSLGLESFLVRMCDSRMMCVVSMDKAVDMMVCHVHPVGEDVGGDLRPSNLGLEHLLVVASAVATGETVALIRNLFNSSNGASIEGGGDMRREVLDARAISWNRWFVRKRTKRRPCVRTIFVCIFVLSLNAAH